MSFFVRSSFLVFDILANILLVSRFLLCLFFGSSTFVFRCIYIITTVLSSLFKKDPIMHWHKIQKSLMENVIFSAVMTSFFGSAWIFFTNPKHLSISRWVLPEPGNWQRIYNTNLSMCVHKAWILKYDTTEMTAINEDCIWWLIENCCLMRKNETFDTERFKSIKGDFCDRGNE